MIIFLGIEAQNRNPNKQARKTPVTGVFPREYIIKNWSIYFGFLINTFYFIASYLSTVALYSFYSMYLQSGCSVFFSYLDIYFWKVKTLSQMFEKLHKVDKK